MHFSRVFLLPLGLALASPAPPPPQPQNVAIAAPAPTPPARLEDAVPALLLQHQEQMQNPEDLPWHKRIQQAAIAAAASPNNDEDLPWHKRQLTVSLFGATAVVSNGVVCAGILAISGCVGQPGTNTEVATNGLGTGTVTDTGTGTTDLYGIPTTYTQSTSTAGAAPVVTEVNVVRIGVVAGAGVLALGML